MIKQQIKYKNKHITVEPCYLDFKIQNKLITNSHGGRHGRDHMVVGFTTTCAISAYHH